jgi:thymidylate synthase (FAD)
VAGENLAVQVFDHGYIKLVEHWGSDERIIEAARMSTDKGFQGWGPIHIDTCPVHPLHASKGFSACVCDANPGDEKLLAYLWKHKHTTPFEMAGLTIEVQAPIFVLREWQRHRTQSYNELSARYTILPDLFYVPSVERLMGGRQSSSNKQSSTGGFSQEEAASLASQIRDAYHQSRLVYDTLLDHGLARELARTVVPIGQYSRMRASANLWNWLHFMTLRTAAGTQWEIVQYAVQVATLVAQYFPRTFYLWTEDHPDF